MSNHFSRGINFSDTAPGNSVTADRLHELIEAAVMLPAAITERSEATSLSSGDKFPVVQGGEIKYVNYANINSTPVGLGVFRNLVVKNNSGSPDTTVDITADEILLRSTGDILIRAATVSVSANITVSGENGLDTGSEEAAWYYIWIISNGSTVSALLSKNATAPTMPSGFTYKTRVGGVLNKSTGNFWKFQQNDTEYATEYQAATLSSVTFTANADPSVSTNYQAVVLDGSAPKPYIPPTACRVYGFVGRTDGTSLSAAIAANDTGLGAMVLVGQNSGTAQGSFTSSAPFNVPIVTVQTVYIKFATTATNVGRIGVCGFRIKP